jgi:adenylate kinase family enzyme
LPVIELDKHFWPADLTPLPREQWRAMQGDLIGGDRWILDGDLGPYDALDVRLKAAETVIVLNFPLWRCAWRAVRRSSENAAFWRWLACYRRRSLPRVLAAVTANATDADLHVLRNPHDVRRFLDDVRRNTTGR